MRRCVLSEFLKDQQQLPPEKRLGKKELFKAAHEKARKLQHETGGLNGSESSTKPRRPLRAIKLEEPPLEARSEREGSCCQQS